MKVFTSEQIRSIDKTTIEKQPILSINLMEKAATQLCDFVTERFGKTVPVSLFAGPGNNGGDAVALARLLFLQGYDVHLYLLAIGNKLSEDCELNVDRYNALRDKQLKKLTKDDQMPEIPENHLVIEGIFGSGLTRPAEGWPAKVINFINELPNTCLSVDIPSGLFSEDNRENTGAIVEADYTISFEFPKLAFFMPENENYVGEWHAKSIGLLPDAIREIKSSYYYTKPEDLPALNQRKKFAHKGNFGHALLVSGSYGKTGAAVLASRACIRSGSGLLSVHIPESSYEILQATVPEAMLVIDETEQLYCRKKELEKYSVAGAGPGIGLKKSMQDGLKMLIDSSENPMVLDADALNILAQHKEWLKKLPKETIITPHLKEFDRLAGNHTTHFERLYSARQMAKKYNINIVLKGANTAVVDVSGDVFFNSSGNPAMAKGGSGDVLTGIILGLLSSGYQPLDAARLGVYVHGKAADLALENQTHESLIASDMIEYLGKAYKFVRKIQEVPFSR